MGKYSKGISNIDILRIFRCLAMKYPILMTYFKGVVSADELHTIQLKNKECCIINLSRVHEIGTHFVALSRKGSSLIYFDSLGLDIFQPDISNYLLSQPYNIKYIQKRIQPYDSKLCGYYCVLFCLTHNLIKIEDFFTFFSLTDLYFNDISVLELLCAYISYEL